MKRGRNLIGVEGGGMWGCKGGKGGALHLKRKKKNGSPEIETCKGGNEMAKEGRKCERKGAQRMCKFADGMKSGGPIEIKKKDRMMM